MTRSATFRFFFLCYFSLNCDEDTHAAAPPTSAFLRYMWYRESDIWASSTCDVPLPDSPNLTSWPAFLSEDDFVPSTVDNASNPEVLFEQSPREKEGSFLQMLESNSTDSLDPGEGFALLSDSRKRKRCETENTIPVISDLYRYPITQEGKPDTLAPQTCDDPVPRSPCDYLVYLTEQSADEKEGYLQGGDLSESLVATGPTPNEPSRKKTRYGIDDAPDDVGIEEFQFDPIRVRICRGAKTIFKFRREGSETWKISKRDAKPGDLYFVHAIGSYLIDQSGQYVLCTKCLQDSASESRLRGQTFRGEIGPGDNELRVSFKTLRACKRCKFVLWWRLMRMEEDGSATLKCQQPQYLAKLLVRPTIEEGKEREKAIARALEGQDDKAATKYLLREPVPLRVGENIHPPEDKDFIEALIRGSVDISSEVINSVSKGVIPSCAVDDNVECSF